MYVMIYNLYSQPQDLHPAAGSLHTAFHTFPISMWFPWIYLLTLKRKKTPWRVVVLDDCPMEKISSNVTFYSMVQKVMIIFPRPEYIRLKIKIWHDLQGQIPCRMCQTIFKLYIILDFKTRKWKWHLSSF